jgi:hypothetical protein
MCILAVFDWHGIFWCIQFWCQYILISCIAYNLWFVGCTSFLFITLLCQCRFCASVWLASAISEDLSFVCYGKPIWYCWGPGVEGTNPPFSWSITVRWWMALDDSVQSPFDGGFLYANSLLGSIYSPSWHCTYIFLFVVIFMYLQYLIFSGGVSCL